MCFLCKDGGDLIECDDSKNKHCDANKRCKKVYHSYCLAYVVEDDGRDWICPRHFCDFCGTTSLRFVCKFCPMSICKACPEAMVKKVRRIVNLDEFACHEISKPPLFFYKKHGLPLAYLCQCIYHPMAFMVHFISFFCCLFLFDLL